MRLIARVAATAFVMMFLAAEISQGQSCCLTSRRTQEWYTDSAFQNLVGWETMYCDLSYTSTGTLGTQYRILYRDACDGSSTYSVTCWSTNGSGGYSQMTCP